MLAKKFFYGTLNLLSGLQFNSKQANFSIISRKVVQAHRQFFEQTRFYSSTIKWLGFKTGSIEAQHGLRHEGQPSYTLRRRIKLASDIIINFSERPLKLAVSLGVSFSAFSIVFAIWIAFKAANSEFSIAGWPSIIVAVFFTSGINLMMLGLFGIYLGRVFREVKQRPLFIIDEKINV